MKWFSTLAIDRAVPTPRGWRIEWIDGRDTLVDMTVIEVAPGGEKVTHKTIRWAA